jgi:two-component system sensor histidine kinase ResE
MTLTVSRDVARVDVGDSGKGIPPEDLGKIFSKYYTTDTRSHNSSAGLGLSISKSIIERHMGSIAVTSTAGQGSTFTVCLPILRLDHNDEKSPCYE